MPVAVCQEWEESERGWGTRPDGCSLHLSREDRDLFVKEYWDRQPDGPAPDEYSRPVGEPYAVDVSTKLHKGMKEKADKKGIWLLQHDFLKARADGILKGSR